ncbi:MAG: HlyD family efflux transporter periplasmic adaptor subunit [Deltaproteobacteria bacterium]|nr:HlyD family efflux transporter periplasmic adaptor subunit [Deltaproteobacteria bacterium]
MSQKGWIILAAVVLGLLLGAGYTIWRSINDRGDFVVSGIIEADDVQVGSRVGGRVLKVVAREGQGVKAGDTLLLLESDELSASLAEAQASLRQAEARLAELRAGFRQEEIDQAEASVNQYREQLNQLVAGPRRQEIDQARANWLAAKTQYENAERFRKRMEDLRARELIAQQEYEDARTKSEEAEQKMRSERERYDLFLAGTRAEEIAQARHRLAEAEARLRQLRGGYRKEEIAQARAAVEMAAARVEMLRTQLKETVIRAPFDAVVDVLDLRPGDLVGPNKPVATLLRTSGLWVRAYLPEAKLGFVRPELAVKVRVDSFPGRDFAAVVRRVHRQAEFTPRNVQTQEERVLQVFQVEVAVQDPDRALRPGMNADVYIRKSEQ